jgi:hypothetical protein
MPSRSITAALVFAALAAVADPALAFDYGGFSGRGFNPVFYYGAPPPPRAGEALAHALGIQTNEVPLGTAAKPAPVYPPALIFRVYPGLVYNAPPAASDLYRVVPFRKP